MSLYSDPTGVTVTCVCGFRKHFMDRGAAETASERHQVCLEREGWE